MLVALVRRYLRPYRGPVAAVMVLQIISTLASLYLPTVNAAIIDDGVATGDTALIARLGLVMLAVTALQGICAVGAVYFGSRTGMGLGRDLRTAVFGHVITFSEAETARFGAPTLLTRTTNDVRQIQVLVQMTATIAVAAPIMCVGGSLGGGNMFQSNQAYAMAKIAGIYYIEAFRTQYGRKWISAMPTNLYGPKDNFDLQSSHVLPAFIRRFHEAKMSGASTVTVWGTGSPRREFLHVDDLAKASLMLLENYDSSETINVGWGDDLPIRQLAETVAAVVGFEGEIEWDTSKPDGMPRKLLDTSRINALGWQPEITLQDGVSSTYQWFIDNWDGNVA
jgi:ABC-type multidrug transport system fused ATPase/permease subunit